MKKAMQQFFADGGGSDRVSLRYWSPDVDAAWSVDVDAPDSLQLVYKREVTINDEARSENFWLYLSPADAAVIGRILTGYAAANGEAS